MLPCPYNYLSKWLCNYINTMEKKITKLYLTEVNWNKMFSISHNIVVFVVDWCIKKNIICWKPLIYKSWATLFLTLIIKIIIYNLYKKQFTKQCRHIIIVLNCEIIIITRTHVYWWWLFSLHTVCILICQNP